VAMSPGIVPEMETTDQPNGECDSLESRTTASVRGATIHCTDNAERSCSSPATGGTYTYRNDGQSQTRTQTDVPKVRTLHRRGTDVGHDGNDRTLAEEYARNKAQITVVTFLHKRVFQANALARTWSVWRLALVQTPRHVSA